MDNEDIEKTLDDIKKCQYKIDNQMSKLSRALNTSFKDAEYATESKARYDDIRATTGKSVNSLTKWSYNNSDTAVDSIKLKFSDLSYGYSWMTHTFNKCINYFPPMESSASNKIQAQGSTQK